MTKWKIYHNPKCSKSREALTLLQSHNLEPQVIEYLKQHPSEDDLRSLIDMLESPASALIRTKEDEFQNLECDLNSTEDVIKALVAFPKLLERPIVIKDNKAVIGRPVENIKKLI